MISRIEPRTALPTHNEKAGGHKSKAHVHHLSRNNCEAHGRAHSKPHMSRILRIRCSGRLDSVIGSVIRRMCPEVRDGSFDSMLSGVGRLTP